MPKIQKPPDQPVPKAPIRSDAEIAQAAAEQRRRFYQDYAGRRSTLGGGLDFMGFYPTSSAKLLGAA